ncbi:MAG TPA: cytochrome c peroxidase [Bacteroidia bacterium]|nr:cytochrome c peroxidase [Bacteroidia bacterium]
MKYKVIFTTFILFIAFIAGNSFIVDNPYFAISNRDVELKIPRGFPKPYYNFEKNKLNAEVFVLGRKLFYDNILSKDNTVNCGSCHQRIAAFAHIDHRLSHGIYAKIGTRNVPPLQNLIWKDTYMWDGGVNNLEVQPINPITSPIEMDETLANVLIKLRRDSVYVHLFNKAYKDSLINSERLLKALAQFTGLMISANSRYDQYKKGKDTFSHDEKRGLSLFMQKCSACHTEPLFTDNSYRNNGIQADTTLHDRGREGITGIAGDRNRFKVPGLRNIAMTYPHMHDGRFRNLREVLNHYSDFRSSDASVDPAIQRIGPLSENEKNALIAFLNTLTDKTFLYDRRFADPSGNY